MIIKFKITNNIISIIFTKKNKIIFIIKEFKKKIKILLNKFKNTVNFYNEKLYFQNYKYTSFIKKIIDFYNGKKIN
ncbi:hypothetical protein [Candidatus Carsonella ruddii]|uniref:Ribosomal protein L18 n=1 Tax=Candidatus Carsonella ruddii PC isolate NHV TaxID=1202540 RepID=J3Z2H1_CARRU|nr:hypothetical protein [Candidatus Carsonella ruddii]AFP84369.1 ribosomal protein L18 [Candidatus Carsonella ruddii PC isolate NHV]